MPIPESQLETWSRQGSITQSSGTYQTIRRALLAEDASYADKSFEVFLQGSYGNDTNIYAESDVDIVIRLDSIFRYDLDGLTEPEKAAYRAYVSPASYSFSDFKAGVIAQLQRNFGTDAVEVGSKAIKIKANGSRRSADVVVCYEYRRFKSFSASRTTDFISGIIFPSGAGEVINFPRHHSANLTEQHQATRAMLKPMARILKNMRSRMVDDGRLGAGIAPSYYLEGLFYNVPADQYASTSYGDTFCNGINWILQADRAKLVCANWQYYLLGDSNVQWSAANFNSYLDAVCQYWRDW